MDIMAGQLERKQTERSLYVEYLYIFNYKSSIGDILVSFSNFAVWE